MTAPLRKSWQAVAVRRLVLTGLACLLVLTGCSGGSTPTKPEEPPAARLAAAKRSFDSADFISFTLHTAGLPAGLQGLLSATGTGTHAPAFTGDVKVQSATDLTAPLIAVNGHVYAKLPFVGWSELNPADYGAPDPAVLMDRDTGISALFTATTDLKEGASERVKDQILTSISGTLPGAAVHRIFPSARAKPFTVNYLLDDQDNMSGVQITGPFYAGDYADVTYFLELSLDADAVDIAAPI